MRGSLETGDTLRYVLDTRPEYFVRGAVDQISVDVVVRMEEDLQYYVGQISFVGKLELRTSPSMMPEAPAMAVKKLLARTGLTMADMKVVKDHNPFAVNDAIFAKVFDYDWRKMNTTGCSLVWGHPQGPTLTRVTIEALEEAPAE